MRERGILLIDQEINECKALKRLRVSMKHFAISHYVAKVPTLPNSNNTVMVAQALTQKPLPMRPVIAGNG